MDNFIRYALIACMIATAVCLLVIFTSDYTVADLQIASSNGNGMSLFYKIIGIILTTCGIYICTRNYLDNRYRKIYWQALSDDEARFVRQFANADHLKKKACLRMLDTDLSGDSIDDMDSSFFTKQTVKK